ADFHTFYAHTEPWIARAAYPKYGHPVRDAELLRALSPIHRFDALRAPGLVGHGRAQPGTRARLAEKTVACLAKRLGVGAYESLGKVGYAAPARSARDEDRDRDDPGRDLQRVRARQHGGGPPRRFGRLSVPKSDDGDVTRAIAAGVLQHGPC